MGQTDAIQSSDVPDGDGGNGDGNRNRGAAGGLVPRHVGHVTLPSAAASETAALISMIERAAADPNVSIDRIERMYAMFEKASARAAKSAFVSALMRAKSEFPRIIKTGEITGNKKDAHGNKVGKEKQSTYAKWEEVCGQIEPALARNDLALTFRTEQPGLDRVSVTAVLTHIDGHSESAQMALAIDATGGKNNAQGWGSSISYGKRYTSFAILNLVGHDDKDTDAAPIPADTIDEDQEIALRDELEAAGKSVQAFCTFFKLAKLGDLPATRVEEAKAAIRRKK